MSRKVPLEHVEELHQPSRKILWLTEIWGEGERGLQPPTQASSWVRDRITPRCGSMPNAEEAGCDGVEHRLIELEEVALFVDEDCPLQGFCGGQVEADDVVGKVVKDFKGEEKAR